MPSRKKVVEKIAEDAKVDAGVGRLLLKWRDDPRFFIESCLGVKEIQGGSVVPFSLNPGQEMVLEVVERQMLEQRPVRVCVLKSRRQGITTLGQALIYWATSTRAHMNGMVVAHKDEKAREIFRIAKFFYDGDKRHGLGLAPELEASNERALRFANPDKRTRHERPGLNSSLLVESAEGNSAGHGDTLHAVHLSEVGRYDGKNAGEVMNGVGIALSKSPGTLGIMESTARGRTGLWYEICQRAMRGKGEWEFVFLPWTIDPNNTFRLGQGERENWEWRSIEERDICEKHQLSLAQMKWRRMMLDSPDMQRPGVPAEVVFHEQFPLTPDEAFSGTGAAFFQVAPLQKMEAAHKREAVHKGELGSPIVLSRRAEFDWTPVKPTFAENGFGPLLCWEAPQENEDYVVGADIAEGTQDGDASVAVVIKRSNLEVVARLKAQRMDPDQFGEACCLLAWHYRLALLAIERNGPGIAALTAARRAHYSRLFSDASKKNERPEARYGWRTTPGNRRFILDALEGELREGNMVVHSADFFAECSTVVLVETQTGFVRPQAAIGKHDDEVMATAIALQVHMRSGSPWKDTVPKEETLDHPMVQPWSETKKKKRRFSEWS